MSLYGALFSGVSGLAAQSSAMGAISDNISNVNTIGYKSSKVAFNTLVTQQVSTTNYAPGGVQSKVRAGIDVQGLLQATNSSTDVALSGQGFLVVNEAAHPEEGDQFAYTRAGSFKVDSDGFLQNTAGWYLQGWPLQGWDNSKQASTVQVGNNVYMKSYQDDNGDTVYINDNIVSSRHLQPLNLNEMGGTASQTRNLRMGANLPNGADIGTVKSQPVTIYDSLGGDSTVLFQWSKVSQNNWDLEAVPPESSKSMTLKNSDGEIYGAMARFDFKDLPTTAGSMTIDIKGTTYTFNTTSGTDGATADTFYTDPSSVGLGTFVGSLAGDINTAFQMEYNGINSDLSGNVGVGDLLDITVDSTTYNFNSAAEMDGMTAAQAASHLNADSTFSGLGLKAADNNGKLYIYSEDAMTFTIAATSTGVFAQGSFSASSKTSTGIKYCEQLSGTNSLIVRHYDNTNDLTFSGIDSLVLANGDPATLQGQEPNTTGTFTLPHLDMDPTTTPAIEFDGNGLPKVINVAQMEVDWANGSTDMNGDDVIGLFLGNIGIRDGMSQLDGEYQLSYWNQNGAKFGNFSGVSIGEDGIVTALFDNGVTRPVFQIPVSTFVNPNGMTSLSGNVYIATDYSGEPTLRSAGAAGSGSMAASSLEASTVDIGSEFTTMIVTQRAYSAAAKIITTADQMLDELVQIKR